MSPAAVASQCAGDITAPHGTRRPAQTPRHASGSRSGQPTAATGTRSASPGPGRPRTPSPHRPRGTLRADAGRKEQAVRGGQVELRRHVGRDRSRRRPGRSRRAPAVVQRADLPQQVLLDGAPVPGSGCAARLSGLTVCAVCTGPAFRIRGPRDDKQAAAGLGRPGHERAHRAEAEVGMHGDRIGRKRRALAEVRLGVGVVRGSRRRRA